ncbi:NAD(P)H-binding protein [Streptomyces sp. NPDC004539]|uniref:NAD(P)-dependent oxidoreductase n=1 Tax=Streptomyces sp. NPDC004539 TaxID=3154280 RepID=UPI0033AFE2C7
MDGIVVFGAGGRAGRAVCAEARGRGLPVIGVVRDPERHPGLAADGVTVVRGDVTDPRAVPAGRWGVVQAAVGFEAGFFVRAVDALLAAEGVSRLVLVGLFADLVGADGRAVMEDPAVFPAEHLAFAREHAAGLARLRAVGGGVDWAVLTPGGELTEGPGRGRYVVGGDRVPEGAPGLSYTDLAVAVVDEVVVPTLRGARGAVWVAGCH